MGLVGPSGEVVAEESTRTPTAGAPEALLAAIAEGAAGLGRAAAQPSLVGVSVAGFVDRDRSCMIYNPNLPLLAGFPLRQALADRLGLPCFLDVDSNAAALAEHRFGNGQGSKRFLCLAIGTGVGGGVVVGGELLRYCGGCAGDLGHVVVDPRGPGCPCGGTGCLEAVASAPRLEALTGSTAREAIRAALAGDEACRAALAEMGGWIGVGLCTYVSLFDLDRIVIGGGVSAAGDLLLDPARAHFARHAPRYFRRDVSIELAALGPQAGVVGAACVGFAG